jgi:hypothetical protein
MLRPKASAGDISIGADDLVRIEFQQDMEQHLIQPYVLPTDIARYDTMSFRVRHARSAQDPHGLPRFGHSKDHRPDLPHFNRDWEPWTQPVSSLACRR